MLAADGNDGGLREVRKKDMERRKRGKCMSCELGVIGLWR